MQSGERERARVRRTARPKSPILRYPPPGKTVSAELLAPGLAIGAAFESAYPVAKGNYYDMEARIILHTY